MNDIIKLANGKEVAWDEFSKWSATKQKSNTINPTMRKVQTPLGIFPSIASAALANNISAHSLRRKLNSNEFDEFRYIDNQKNSHKNRVYNTKGEANPMARRIMTPLGQFETLNSAAAALNISLDVLNKRSKSEKFKDYYYLDSRVKRVPRKNPSNAGKNSGVARRIMTPIGTFDTVREAHKALGIDVTTLYRRLGNAVKNPDYYYL